VTLSASALRLGVVFVGVPVRHRVTMTNLSSIPVDFRVDPYVGALAPDAPPPSAKDKAARGGPLPAPSLFELAPSERVGILAPRESRELELLFTPRAAGAVDAALLAIDVLGMPHPLGVELHMLIRDVTVAYALVDDATGRVIPLPATASGGGESAAAGGRGAADEAAARLAAVGTATSARAGALAARLGGFAARGRRSSAVALAALGNLVAAAGAAAGAGDDAEGEGAAAAAAARAAEDADAVFAATMDAMDDALRADPVARAIRTAFARSRAMGARIGAAPPLDFLAAGARGAQPLLGRRSFTLHAINLSGIAARLTLGADALGAPDRAEGLEAAEAAAAAERTDDAVGAPWPAL
jgi:hypothetical protein